MKKIITLALAIAFMGAGCAGNSRSGSYNDDLAVDACIKQNGVPIIGSNGWMQNCKFKP